MKKNTFSMIGAAMMMAVVFTACESKKEHVDINPIESIFYSTVDLERVGAVCRYLADHPEFIRESDSVGYLHWFTESDMPQEIWRDRGEIRLYPISHMISHAEVYNYIVQFKDDGRVDTAFLEDNEGEMLEFYEIKAKSGKRFYILRTGMNVVHQGETEWEFINAFSVDNGRLVKEKLFHANGRVYDNIAVECGGQRYLPLDLGELVLIRMLHFDDDEGTPTFIIAEINGNDWPTGNGLRYEWNGNWFEYVGKCRFDANEYSEY